MTLGDLLLGMLTTHAAIGRPARGDYEWIIWEHGMRNAAQV
jgi:hypothetical protein